MTNFQTHIVTMTEEDAGKRLDKALAEHLTGVLSRARIQSLLAEGHVSQQDNPLKSAKAKVKGSEEIAVRVPPAIEADPVPQDIPLDIVYEDDCMLVINKPVGMVVHPAAGNWDKTLVNALMFYCGDQLSGIGGVRRPGIVHRLDKETSGLMVVAKTDEAHKGLSEQLAERTLKRIYHAIVWGHFSVAEGTVDANIGRSRANRQMMAIMGEFGGKTAVTHYAKIKQFGLTASLVECRLQTGRTHQIRVHMAHIKHWLIGDPTYGRQHPRKYLKKDKTIGEDEREALLSFPRQALHAAGITFIHPISGEEMSFESELPSDMLELVTLLGKKNVV